jgi:hypothetical protein
VGEETRVRSAHFTGEKTMQLILSALIILAILLLAMLANRRLGLILDAPKPAPTDAEKQWQQELATLNLDERHPYC